MPTKSYMTKLSAKGQLILPKAIRQRRQWVTGTQLVVEETTEGVLLRPAAVVRPTKPKEVFGSLSFSGKPKTVEEMNAGILVEAKRRFERS
jgi:AbrB family looped-hinge helix DNA binding protein